MEAMSRIDRRRFLAAGAAGFAACGKTAPKRPNALFVMTDDQAVGQMSCEDNKLLSTPNMDRIAAGGTHFENAFCTNSLCAPSRATALSGTYSHINGVKGNSEGRNNIEKIDPKLPLYPELLKQAGYRTGVVGKWHLQEDPRGFDYSCILPGQGLYFDPEFIENGQRKKIPGYATDITTDLALRFLDTVGAEPFLLIYQHKAPHRPFKPAPRHAKMFEDVEFPYPTTFDDDFATRPIAKEAADMSFERSLAGDYPDLPKKLSGAEKKKWLYQRFVKDHYRALYGVDENLGRVLDYLDKKNLSEDTLIIYTSDNGFFLGEHGWYDKRFMYEPSFRVPLLVRYPRAGKPGRVESRYAANIDYAPTILDFAGVEIPKTMQGRSLRPLIEGHPNVEWRQSVYYTYHENSWTLRNASKEQMTDATFQYFTPHRVSPHRGVRMGDYKLIEYYSEGDVWELFDLGKDPHERRNVYSDPAYATVAADLKRELARLRREYSDS
jgi:arylsulfatase A-like enzyme